MAGPLHTRGGALGIGGDAHYPQWHMKIENVTDTIGNRFASVVVSARRARQINGYFHQLGAGIGEYVPPQVHSLSRKPLTIAMEEISDGKVAVETVEE